MAYEKTSLKFGNIADLNSQHVLVMPEMDGVIRSVLNKEEAIIARRIRRKTETHEIFRWVEEASASRTAAFIDPRNISGTYNGGITRVEKMAKIKAMSNKISFGLFDTALTKLGTFPQVLQDDTEQMIRDMVQTEAANIWLGNDTSYSSPTTNQYFGLLSAITQTATIPVKTATSPTIAQGIKTNVAKLSARLDVKTMPTAIYCNPLSLDFLEIEENAQIDKQKSYTLEVIPGTTVVALMTVAGLLPIITDPNIPIDTSHATLDKHKFILVDESKIVRHGLSGFESPVVYKMGEVSSLLTDYTAVQFSNVVCQFPDKSHMIITKEVTR